MRRRGLFVTLLLLVGLAQAAEPLRLGVLAVRPKQAIQAQFQPLAEYLSAAFDGTPVTLHVLNPQQWQQAPDDHSVDLLLTNPTSYLHLRSHHTLRGALATLRTQGGGQPTTQMGGVIVTRADRADIARLGDLRGRRIGILDACSLGGFQAQARELQAAGIAVPLAGGAPVPRSSAKSPPGAELDFQTPGADDAVVAAVLDGSVDAGFVRAGQISERLLPWSLSGHHSAGHARAALPQTRAYALDSCRGILPWTGSAQSISASLACVGKPSA